MRKNFTIACALLLSCFTSRAFSNHNKTLDEPDSAYLFSYASVEHGGRNGLHFAWSRDRENWHGIGPAHSFLRSDFGTWGAQKRMLSPFLFRDREGLWHCVWSLNEEVGEFAHAASENLYDWKRQSYPAAMEKGNVVAPEVSAIGGEKYLITWETASEGINGIYKTTTTDFKHYSATEVSSANERLKNRQEVTIDGKPSAGIVHRVSWDVIEGLLEAWQLEAYQWKLNSETTAEDPVRFSKLEPPIQAQISVEDSNSKAISDILLGIFFEDINYAADGGLYAELVQNRDFEYDPADRRYRDDNWNHYTSWSFTGDKAGFTIDSVSPVHPNNKHYAVVNISKIGEGLQNEGFDGIAIRAGEKYNFSVFAKTLEGKGGSLKVHLIGKDGKIYGEASTGKVSAQWKKLETTITASETADEAMLIVIPQAAGKVALDIVSLFPQKTFKGRKNGLRADLAQTIADIHPRFVRFPGGCVAHGDGLGNIYRWKNSIGPLEARVPMRNIWNYHQTLGLGYFEYFQFCEDIGAEPVPVLAAGVPCQNSSVGGHGQQCGIPMDEMDEYVQDILDLIEWANGDKNSEWGRKRAQSGHPEPFNLKYIGIGNEDLITDVFEERFTMIFEAIKKSHPEITVIGTVGPFYKGTDYEEGWDIAEKLNVPMVDEHYYQPPGWFIHNQDFYDKYDRSKSKVYLGEYAGHLPGRPNNLETALSEALYLTAIERNGDIVSMASYAPLLAKEGHTQWNPDMIYFNNTKVILTPGYHVQKLYGQNSGSEYVPSLVQLSNNEDAVKKRFGVSVVKEASGGSLIIKLVNMLPEEINSTINLEDYQISNTDAKVTVLKGDPGDKDLTPETRPISVSGSFEYKVPAYSFSVIRVKL